jgi:hypothetical protein
MYYLKDMGYNILLKNRRLRSKNYLTEKDILAFTGDGLSLRP